MEEWLRGADPALAWQVERDLLGAPASVYEATRARTATEGIAARLASLQSEDGLWAHGAYFPGGFFEDPEARTEPGQPWTATTWSLTSLRQWGLPVSALRPGTGDLIAEHARWEYDDLPYWGGEVDACINAMTLANAIWLGRPAAEIEALARWFVDHEKTEGGWNCPTGEGPDTSVRASLHSTRNALAGLLAFERHQAQSPTAPAELAEAVHGARRRGEEYLLQRHLLRRLSGGERIEPGLDDCAYPMRWRATALHSLTYFWEASAAGGTDPDPRLREAVEVVRAQQEPDGRFRQGHVDPGRVWFAVDAPEGEPSPWVTFLATRVLRWWDSHQ